MAYEVMLKPAIIDAPKRPLSPPKERFTSKEEIIQKLKEAEERRRVGGREGSRWERGG